MEKLVLGQGEIVLVIRIRSGGAESDLPPDFEKTWHGRGWMWEGTQGPSEGPKGGEREVQGRECGGLAFLGVLWEVTGETARAEVDSGES